MPNEQNMVCCAGRAVVLSGGTSGVGRATARRLVSEGARLLAFGRDKEVLPEVVDEIRAGAAKGGEAYCVAADATDPESIRRVFREADERLGGVDVLVCCAALPANSIIEGDLASSYQQWLEVIQTNLLGYLACCREAIDRMRRRGGGHIVLIGSLSAHVRETGSDIYVATKSGLQGFAESLRKHINGENIKITLIEPGLVATHMSADQVPLEQQSEKVAAGDMLRPEDVAGAVLYALTQPPQSDVIGIQIRPRNQVI